MRIDVSEPMGSHFLYNITILVKKNSTHTTTSLRNTKTIPANRDQQSKNNSRRDLATQIVAQRNIVQDMTNFVQLLPKTEEIPKYKNIIDNGTAIQFSKI